MPPSDLAAVQRVLKPKEWPPAPAQMTITALNQIEACPRRWALASATYPEIWDRRGYPAKIHMRNLRGSVVHLAIETLTKAFAKAGCPSVRDPSAVEVMRGLGGHSQIVADCIRRVLEQHDHNPRAEHMIDLAHTSLRAQIAGIRSEVQSFLGRVNLQPRPTVISPDSRLRNALGPGVYAEVELRVPSLGWRGKADIVTLSGNGCEIRDFKTGEPSNEHWFQICVYALLWYRDQELNTNGKIATKLTISYPTGDVDVDPPSPGELEALECELGERTRAAGHALDVHPPEAKPSIATCQYCYVRQLCDDYWQVETQQRLAEEAVEEIPFVDVEVTLIDRHGPLSWNTIVEVSRDVELGRRLLLRMSSHYPELHSGFRIRVLDAHLTSASEDESQPAVITMNAMSEWFIVPEQSS